MGTWSSFTGVKQQGREADNSSPTSAEIKKAWIYTLFYLILLMHLLYIPALLLFVPFSFFPLF
jgi:hypothetical protein